MNQIHHRRHRLVTTIIALAAMCGTALAQYDPPPDYYGTITGNPNTLRSELHLIISDDYGSSLTGPGNAFQPDGSGHRVRSYDALRQALPLVDQDPGNPDHVILAYNGASVQGAWSTGGTIWNREHRWPVSWGLGSSGPDYSDMHQLTACDPAINSSRGNRAFGTPDSIGGYGRAGDHWYPGDNDIPGDPDSGNDTGDVARVLFYMAVRYDGNEPNTLDLELRDGDPGQVGMIYYGDGLASALKWHFRDAPSTHERRRNHRIFSDTANPGYYQGNRNPFADRPEYVWTIFGDGQNDSRLYLGDNLSSHGASSLRVHFGNVPVGAPVPPPRGVLLHKAGQDPTYYQVTVSGHATCNVLGRYNAFERGAGSRDLAVGLAPGYSTTAGLKTGMIVIDNLDLSNEGAGTGSLDGDDVIQVSVYVADCPDPFADADGDGDVDPSDFGAFQVCMTGTGDPDGMLDWPGCGCFDRNGDGDIDEGDLGALISCFSGAGVPAAPLCAD